MIAFAQPWALLLLLSLPVLIYLYRLRPQREDARVSTIMFWQRAIKIRDRQRNYQRWLKDLNLLLLLLLALILALALAQPQWQTTALHSQDAILIIDTSASMSARTTTPGRSRFDEAKVKALQIVDSLPEKTKLLVMSSARHAQPQSGFESDRETLKTIVTRLQPTQESGNPVAALGLARTLLQGRQQARLHFVTDGAFDIEQSLATAATEFHLVGDRRNNAAITRFDVRPALYNDNAYEVFVAIRNYGDKAIALPFTFSMDKRVVYEQSVSIDAARETTLSLQFSGQPGSRASATINANDALPADDTAYMAFSSPAPRRILLVSPGNFYLETALRELPGTTLEVLSRAGDSDRATDATDIKGTETASHHLHAYDIVVFDRIQPPALDTGSFLLIDVAADDPVFDAGERTVATAVTGTGNHAMLRDLDLNQLRVAAPRKVTASDPSVQPLFWSDDTVLALGMLQPERRIVYLGFNLLESNFPQQAAFPLFIRRATDWLGASTLTSELPGNRTLTRSSPRERRRQVPSGESFTLQFPPGTEELTIAMPDGSAQAIALTSPRYTFANTSQTGLYQYTADGVQNYIAANLTDESESAINRRLIVDSDNTSQSEGTSGIVKITLWPYFAWAALLLLMSEWWLWCMRREHV